MKKEFVTKRDLLHLVVGFLVCFQATAVMAQSQITIKYHLMFADVSVFNSGLCCTSQAMIDTGALILHTLLTLAKLKANE